jgi:hypothetical protein
MLEKQALRRLLSGSIESIISQIGSFTFDTK